MSANVQKLVSSSKPGSEATRAGLSATQLGCILNDIAETAHAMERMAFVLIRDDNGNERDSRDTTAFTHAVKCMAQRVGFLSDMAADGVPGSFGAVFHTTAEEWMMPPIYNDTAETGEVRHA